VSTVSIQLNAQLSQPCDQAVGALGLFLGASGFLVGALAIGAALLDQLRVSQKRLAIGADNLEVVWPLARLETNLQAGALESGQGGYFFQREPRSPFGRPKMTIASGAARLVGSSSTGYHRRLPATNTFGSPLKTASSPPLDRDNPLKLQGVLRYGLTVAVGVNDFGPRGADEGAHNLEGPRVPVNRHTYRVSHGIRTLSRSARCRLRAHVLMQPGTRQHPPASLGYGGSVDLVNTRPAR
jgi:hypothetical protein